MREFYCTLFNASAGPVYHNEKTGFSSYFIVLPGGHARIELMHRADRCEKSSRNSSGWAHLAFRAGSVQEVDAFASKALAAGATVLREPRLTGDGYYELELADLEGNSLEIVFY
jgi:lactoylglutathione lyase